MNFPNAFITLHNFSVSQSLESYSFTPFRGSKLSFCFISDGIEMSYVFAIQEFKKKCKIKLKIEEQQLRNEWVYCEGVQHSGFARNLIVLIFYKAETDNNLYWKRKYNEICNIKDSNIEISR